MKALLIESCELAPGVRHFLFEVPGGDPFRFIPGQFVSITQELEGKNIVRAYSISSDPDGTNYFTLCLNRVADGRLSPWLCLLEPGMSIEIQQPLGMFTLRPNERDVILVATGTGVAPYRSILRAELGKSARKFTLVFGTRHASTLLYNAEFEAMANVFPDQFRYWPTLSRPEPGWQGRTGYVQTHLEEAVGDRRDVDVFICGLKLMVDEVRTRLKAAGLDRKQIVYEKYD